MKRLGLVAGGVIVATALAIGLAFFLPRRESIYDFIMLYSASLGVISRVPIYDNLAITRLTIVKLSAPGDFSLFPYPYPPWVALSAFYLGFLPVYWAANVWVLLNMAMLVTSALLLSSGWKPIYRIVLSVAALMFIPALGLIVVGQYSAPVLLGAALFGYAARREQAVLTALGLLLMTFKPQLGMFLLPAGFIWLLVQKTTYARRAIGFTLAGAGLLAALGFIADPAWPLAYLQSLLSYAALPGVAGRDLSASLPVMLLKILIGQSSPMWTYCLSAAIVLALLLLFWRFRLLPDIEALIASITLLTLLGSPYLFNYDYVLLLLPLIYLARQTGSLAARLALVGIYLLPWISLILSRDANIFYALAAILLVIMLLLASTGPFPGISSSTGRPDSTL